MVAFHGCLLAGLVPVPLEVPISKRVISDFYFISRVFFLISPFVNDESELKNVRFDPKKLEIRENFCSLGAKIFHF